MAHFPTEVIHHIAPSNSQDSPGRSKIEVLTKESTAELFKSYSRILIIAYG